MMRTLLITFAAAASALAVASPASAQYYPQPQGYAYGHQGNWGLARAMQVRIDNIQRQIERLDRRDILSEREARRLRQDARHLEHRLRFVRQGGLHPAERHDIERRLARLEQRLWRDARDGNRWGNRHHGSYDRDWNDRDDRDDDDRGRGRGRGGRDDD